MSAGQIPQNLTWTLNILVLMKNALMSFIRLLHLKKHLQQSVSLNSLMGHWRISELGLDTRVFRSLKSFY